MKATDPRSKALRLPPSSSADPRHWLSRGRHLLLLSLSLGLLWTAACHVGPMGPHTDHHSAHQHAEEELSTLRQPMISCASRTDKGYVKGKSFTITVVTVDGKPVERETANAYWVMRQAAAKAGVSIRVVSGFRTMAEQQYLYNCYLTKKCNNGNLAAKPGYSNHQSGHALDLNTSVSSVYNWLSAHGGKYGFKRTVPSEKWHWEWWGGGPGGGPCQTTCKPACVSSTKIRGKDCGVGDCAAYGAKCVNDKLGVRCYSAFCPPLGTKKFCHDGKIGSCKDGKVTFTNCPSSQTCTGGSSPVCKPKNKPIGYLDKASCDVVSGWTQDPDHKTTSIDAHVYFNGPAGDKSAKGISTKADVNRADLCKTIGSCKHGFALLSPYSLHDGKAHPIHAYGIDVDKVGNAQLKNSPKELKCSPKVPKGYVKRHIINQASYKDWKVSSFWDKLPLNDSQIGDIEEGILWPTKPVLVKVDGSDTLWLIDGGFKRKAPEGWKKTWRFDEKEIQTWSQAELDKAPTGPDLHGRIMYVVESSGAAYMLDAKLPELPGSTVEPPDVPAPDAGSSPDPDGGTTQPSLPDAGQVTDTGTTPQPPGPSQPTTPPPGQKSQGGVVELPTVLPKDDPQAKGVGCQIDGSRPSELPLGGLALLCLLFATRRKRG